MILAQPIDFYHTPAIWNGEQFGVQQFEFPKLDLGLFQPDAIPTNIRLGHQMEHVFKQLVSYSQRYNILVYNLPIRQEKRTLGEIDFILKDTIHDTLIHVEMTYKFYIIDLDIVEPIHRLIGPNRKDSFFDKMEKIKRRQFPLLHTDQGATALQELDIDHKALEHQCCFKAQLFQPLDSTAIDIGPVNHGCIAGYWLRPEQFSTVDYTNDQYYLPTKSEWMISPHDQVAWLPHAEIQKQINDMLLNQRAPMIWRRKPTGEFQKLFVVWW